MVGSSEASMLGLHDGPLDGFLVAMKEGTLVGLAGLLVGLELDGVALGVVVESVLVESEGSMVGSSEGSMLGLNNGDVLGTAVGSVLGEFVDCTVGLELCSILRNPDGFLEGFRVGLLVRAICGAADGITVGNDFEVEVGFGDGERFPNAVGCEQSGNVMGLHCKNPLLSTQTAPGSQQMVLSSHCIL